MVYKRYNKRRYSRKPNMASRVARVGMRYTSKNSTAHKALRLAKRLADAVNTEYKFHEQQFSGSVDYNGTLTSLMVGLSQGTADTQRIGDSMKLQNLIMRFYLSRATSDSLVRVIIFHDPQSKINAVTDLLQVTGSVFAVLSSKNYDKRFESKVLYDKTFALDGDETTIQRSFTLPLNWHTQFQNGGTTINTGDLRVVFISNQVTTNLPNVVYQSRVTYTDN